MAHKGQNAGSANYNWVSRGPQGEKRCTKCKCRKPLESFCIDRYRPDERSYVCRDCKTTKGDGPTRTERQAMAAIGIKWCRDCKDWTAVHNGLCRAHTNERDRRRYASDPRFKLRRKTRASFRRRGAAPLPIEGKERLWEDFEGCCAYCPSPATTWDHVVAVSKGGKTEPGNIVPACLPCNSSKRTQDVWKWMETKQITPHPMFIETLLAGQGLTFSNSGPSALDFGIGP